MPDHKSNDYKQSAVEYYLLGDESQEGTCRIFQCSPRSLMRWVEKYQITGNTHRKQRDYKAYKVKQAFVDAIKEELRKKPTITISELLTTIQTKYPDFDISPVHLWRLVRDSNITLKLKRDRHTPHQRFGKPVNIDVQLRNFYNTIKKYNIDDIVCIDETSINALQQRKYCYSRKGTRCVVKTDSTKTPTVKVFDEKDILIQSFRLVKPKNIEIKIPPIKTPPVKRTTKTHHKKFKLSNCRAIAKSLRG